MSKKESLERERKVVALRERKEWKMYYVKEPNEQPTLSKVWRGVFIPWHGRSYIRMSYVDSVSLGFAVALAVLITGASQSRQHDYSKDTIAILKNIRSRQSHRGTLTEDKEIELWVELKILFEPDAENLVELQKYLHDPEMVDIWICVAVHHVSIVNRIRYIYAALKRIIHDNGTYNLDVMYKLRVDQQSEMADGFD
ncbi:hypothetical protein Tco_0890541 [Tanacetum coccineum]|uniref:Uncharacterized protein n=1 Tax=Tanacetum coccineum TaxID=301880 RepID=A0ABQ5C6B2_9ASTR